MLEMNATLEDLAIEQSDLREINIRMGDDGAFEVGDDGAVTIAKALANNTGSSITDFRLAACGIEEEGAVALADLLKRTNTCSSAPTLCTRFILKSQGRPSSMPCLSI
jgi:hypothetical protein